MTFNGLLLPLLAARQFRNRCYDRRFRAQRLDGHRYLLEIGQSALWLAAAARVSTILAAMLWPDLERAWHAAWPAEEFPYGGTGVASLLLAESAAVLLNLRPALIDLPLIRRQAVDLFDALSRVRRRNLDAAVGIAVHRHGNALDRLFYRSAKRALPLAVTLRSRKVYVGFVVDAPNLYRENRYLGLLPLAGGYRHPDTLQFRLDTDYAALLKPDVDPEAHLIVVPVDEIDSANVFDPAAYARMRRRSSIAPN